MPEDFQENTMALLHLVHELDVRSRQIETEIEKVITDEDVSIPIHMSQLKLIYIISAAQRDVVRRLLEENQSIHDEIEKIIRKHTKD